MPLVYIQPGPTYDQAPSGAARFVTSGELPAGAGTGDAVKAAYNLWTGPSNAWTTPVTFSGQALFGGGVFSGSVTGANRLVTSGELSAGGGTGDATRTSPNYFTALNVFAGQVTTSGAVHTVGPVAISGGLVAYTPLQDGAGRRFIVSGEATSVAVGGAVGDVQFSTGSALDGEGALHWQTTPNILTVSGSAVIGGAWALPSLIGVARYVTSGELSTAPVIPSGITTVNAQTGPAVSVATGTTGNDVNVSAAGNIITVNVPDAGVFTRGLLTTGAQTISGVKQFRDVVGVNVQASGSFVTYAPLLTNTGQRFVTSGELTAAPIIPSGITTINDQTGPAITVNTGSAGTDVNVTTVANVLTVNVPNASPFARGKMVIGAQTFSGMKAFAGDLVALVGLQASGMTLAYAPIYQGADAAGNRYVTSGDLAGLSASLQSSGITSLNTLTAAVQSFATGATGSDFNINSATATHTFNVPSASAFARGVVTTTAQTLSGVKTVAGGLVSLDAVQTSGVLLTYNGAYGGAVGGATRFVTSGELTAVGTGDFVKAESNYVSGAPQVFAGLVALSGSLQTGGGVQVSGAFTNYVPLQYRDGTGPNRYLTSGELAAGGTGDFVKAQSNYVGGSPQVFAGVLAVSGNLVAGGGTQISGGFLTYAPLFHGAATGAARFVTSGELKPDTGITSLNAQTGTTQTFATATTGTDFAIASAADAHTFSLPSAGPFARGALTPGSQTISGAKTFVGSVQTSGVLLTYLGGYAGVVSGATRYVTSGDLSTPPIIPSGITTVNAQTGPAITVATGATGTDVNVSTAANVVTVNVPDASAFARGVITTTAQTISGVKTLAAPLITSDVQASGVVIIYAGAFAGTVGGATRYVTSGELSSAGSGDFVKAQSNYVSGSPQVFAGLLAISGTLQAGGGVQISGALISYVPLFHGVVSGATRFVTSGDLSAVAAGNGDFVKAQSNYVTGTSQVFGPATHVAVSGTALFGGGVQISGALTTYVPLYQGSVANTQRYVTSGEVALWRAVSATIVSVENSAAQTEIFSTTVPGGTLGTTGSIYGRLFGRYFNNSGAARELAVIVHYGSLLVASGVLSNISAAAGSRAHQAEFSIVAAGATNGQRAALLSYVGFGNTVSGTGSSTLSMFRDLNALNPYLAVDSTQDQSLSVAVSHSAADVNLQYNMYAVVTKEE